MNKFFLSIVAFLCSICVHGQNIRIITNDESEIDIAVENLLKIVPYASSGENGLSFYTNDSIIKVASTDIDNVQFFPYYDYVDLGLSVDWATMDVGAAHYGSRGEYYSWGETSWKSVYLHDNYQYLWEWDALGAEISSTKNDVAHVKWGGSWRMPQWYEIKELVDNCTSENYRLWGVSGRLFTGPNGNSIFLPAVYFNNGWEPYMSPGTDAGYWSSTGRSYNSTEAYYLEFKGNDVKYRTTEKFHGLFVRPVRTHVDKAK